MLTSTLLAQLEEMVHGCSVSSGAQLNCEFGRRLYVLHVTSFGEAAAFDQMGVLTLLFSFMFVQGKDF